MYVALVTVATSWIVANVDNFDTCTVYVSPVPLHVKAGVVSFVSALSPGLVWLTLTLVSTTSVRPTVVSWFPASSRALTRQ